MSEEERKAGLEKLKSDMEHCRRLFNDLSDLARNAGLVGPDRLVSENDLELMRANIDELRNPEAVETAMFRIQGAIFDIEDSRGKTNRPLDEKQRKDLLNRAKSVVIQLGAGHFLRGAGEASAEAEKTKKGQEMLLRKKAAMMQQYWAHVAKSPQFTAFTKGRLQKPLEHFMTEEEAKSFGPVGGPRKFKQKRRKK